MQLVVSANSFHSIAALTLRRPEGPSKGLFILTECLEGPRRPHPEAPTAEPRASKGHTPRPILQRPLFPGITGGGEVAEWLKALPAKGVRVLKPFVGSNPILSASDNQKKCADFSDRHDHKSARIPASAVRSHEKSLRSLCVRIIRRIFFPQAFKRRIIRDQRLCA